MKVLWPHQQRGFDHAISLIESGKQRICLTSPTGGGKSELMRRLILWNQSRGGQSMLLTNRTMLFAQTIRGMQEFGIECGARAAGYEPDDTLPVQVAMVQTEESRVWKNQKWSPFVANLLLIDEAHVNRGGVVCGIIDEYIQQGAAVVGFTATPLEVGHVYQDLVVAGTNSELRSCGAHVPCRTFAPDEPDCRDLKPQKTGEYAEGDVVKAIMTPKILDRVFDRWCELNPQRLPTLGFAPGVKESLWFAEQFYAKGIPSAHIDGDRIWLNGEEQSSSQELRDRISAMSKSGELPVVWNRFVLREGIDWPWLRHGIFATIFGSLTSYLQSGGRLIRKAPGKNEVILQDHGGNWHRHGSLNADREWKLTDTNRSKAEERQKSLAEGKDPEPIVCPQCGAVRLKGDTCISCGFRHTTRSRCVIQADGTLSQVEGKIYRPRTIKQKPDTNKHWDACFWRCRKTGKTFKQAMGLFFREHGYWPPQNLPNMPREELDWSRKIRDVEKNRLFTSA